MIETRRGLPNTCSQCGEQAGPTWWAENVDAARAGQGLCRDCAFPETATDTGTMSILAPDRNALYGLLDDRAVDALLAAGFNSPEQVQEASDETLLEVDGVGPVTLRQIRERIG